MKILFLGDVVGRSGRKAVARHLPGLIARHGFDFVIVNGENAAGGFGITPKIFAQILQCGVDVVTSGNHLWDRKEVSAVLAGETRLLRPANYPPQVEGAGWTLYPASDGTVVGVVNLMGRVFMRDLDCPFRTVDKIIEEIRPDTSVILVDMHAEATSEKQAMGHWLDGRVSAVVGTHTHVPTRDERILPKGTAYITDIGMTGPHDSVIGVRTEDAVRRFLTQTPVKFRVASDDVRLQGVVIENRPAEKVIKCFDGEDTLFYIDPPYVKSSRRRKDHGYAHEMSDADHEQLAAQLHGVQGMVILSAYPSELYNRLFDDWRKYERKSTSQNGDPGKEVLWISPNVPEQQFQLFGDHHDRT